MLNCFGLLFTEALSCYTVAMPDFKKPIRAQKPKDTSWDAVAPWYDDLLESGAGTYQTDLVLPNLLRLLDARRGETVLDLACGQGFFSREIVKTGATVVGADLSKELIDLARAQSPKEIKFVVTPADALTFLNANSVDAIVCVLAIQNIKKPSAVFAECARVLKSGGRMIFVLNHPAFRVAKRSSWGFDEKAKVQYRRVDEYISESETDIVMNPGGKTPVTTASFHHPLQFYFKALHKAGFAVSRLEEWTSAKQSQPGPRASAENKSRKEFPMFMALEMRKLA